MTIEIWGTFMAAAAVMLMIPGPTVLLVLSYAIRHGRRVAVAMAAGVALGDLIAMSASLLGLGAIIATSAALFAAVKWAGALYLIYLGIKMARSVPATGPVDVPAATPRQVFFHAALVTALNPKSIMFFLAFVPHFIVPDRPFVAQSAILIASFVTLAALNALAYALLAARLSQGLRSPRAMWWLARIGAGGLIALGCAAAGLRRA